MTRHVVIHLGPAGYQMADGTPSFVELDGERLEGVRSVRVDSGVGTLTSVLIEFVNVDVAIEADVDTDHGLSEMADDFNEITALGDTNKRWRRKMKP